MTSQKVRSRWGVAGRSRISLGLQRGRVRASRFDRGRAREHRRIGYIGDPEDDLKGALFYHSDVRSYYLRIHLSQCEQILEEIVK